MPEPAAPLDPRARDRFVRRVRHLGRVIGVAAAGATAALSVVAAHAFRGHDGRKKAAAATAPTAAVSSRRAQVPGPEQVPSISGAPAPLEAPSEAPAAVPQESVPQQQAATSGGS